MKQDVATKITGSCFCGAVQYESEVEPKFSFNCHCRDCQKLTGNAYAPLASFPKSALKITGEVKYFASTGISGKQVHRGFCPQCGSRVFGLPEIAKEYISVHVGTMDEPNRFQPKIEFFTSHANVWDILNPDIPHFEKMMKP